jgi:6-phosphogluconolactonase (cycloisomerase 2 family)
MTESAHERKKDRMASISVDKDGRQISEMQYIKTTGAVPKQMKVHRRGRATLQGKLIFQYEPLITNISQAF